MLELRKPNYVGEVPVLTGANRQQRVGFAKVEKTRSGGFIFHVTIFPEHSDVINEGFSLGDYVPDEVEG
jgi:hypothetical protein